MMIDEVFLERGFLLNFKTNRTDATVVLRGHGAAEARRGFFITDAAKVPFNSTHNGPTALRITRSYKHLGSHVQDNATNKQSMCARFGHACAELKPLAKPILACQKIPLKN